MRSCGGLLILVLLVVSEGRPVFAQKELVDGQQLPTFPVADYYTGLHFYHLGQFELALKRFQLMVPKAVRSTYVRFPWVDSIFHEVMMGACFEQLGQLSDAMTHYNRAANIFVRFPQVGLLVMWWYPLTPAQQTNRVISPWGRIQRPVNPGIYPMRYFPIHRGLLREYLLGEWLVDRQTFGQRHFVNANDILPAIQNGDVLMFDMPEYVRCLSVMLQGRYRILGPMASFDPLSHELLRAFRPSWFPVSYSLRGRERHWSQTWMTLLQGLAFLGAGNEARAKSLLQESVVMPGQMVHHLSASAMLQLGKIEASHRNWKAASNWFQDASHVAYVYQDSDTIVESFKGWFRSSLQDSDTQKAPLAPAIKWAKTARYQAFQHSLNDAVTVEMLRQLSFGNLQDAQFHYMQSSLLLIGAEQQLEANRVSRARRMIREFLVGNRRSRVDSRLLEAQYEFLSARLAYSRKDQAAGDAALQRSLAIQASQSPRRFQFQLMLRMLNGGDDQQILQKLYPYFFTQAPLWEESWEVADSIVYKRQPKTEVMDEWFQRLFYQGKRSLTFEISEQIRRERYLSTLPLAGRMLSFAWIFEAPDHMLPPRVREMRRIFSARFPEYGKLTQQWQTLHDQFRKQPLVPETVEDKKQQQSLVRSIIQLDATRRLYRRQAACSRGPVEPVFPPLRRLTELQKQLPEGRAIWSFYISRQRVYAFWLTSRNFDSWEVGQVPTMTRTVAEWLRAIGNVGRRPLTSQVLSDSNWKTMSQGILNQLLQGRGSNLLRGVKELVVVPDGVLWYLPFELLGYDVFAPGEPFSSLIGRVQVSYVPTASLAIPTSRLSEINTDTVVSLGRDRKSDETSWDKQLGEDMASLPTGEVFQFKATVKSSVPVALANNRIFLQDLDWPGNQIFGWNPFAYQLSATPISLPPVIEYGMHGMRSVILARQRTPAEWALDSKKVDTSGHSMFFMSTNLMASGIQRLLISRWRVGGQSARYLIRDFLQEQPHSTPSDAWQRAVLLSGKRLLDPAGEPRLDSQMKMSAAAEHPFFWSGYLPMEGGL